MARLAGFRRRPIEEHGLLSDRAGCLVAISAPHRLVRTLERKSGLRFVIEERGLPLVGVVAINTTRILPFPRELSCMRVLMATLTLLGGRLEDNVLHRHFQVGRLVALDALDLLMRSVNREFDGRVIERTQDFPRLRGVAFLAAHLGLVRIGVTGIAGLGTEVKLARRV